MLSDAPACAAMDMLDSWSRAFDVAPGQREVITAERWLQALHVSPDTADDPVTLFVRDSFDSLFYFMAMFEHYVDHQFVHFRDVVFPLDYYVRILAEDRDLHTAYLTTYGMSESLRFLARFPTSASSGTRTAAARCGLVIRLPIQHGTLTGDIFDKAGNKTGKELPADYVYVFTRRPTTRGRSRC